ncbi:hypothetical protein MRBLMI12_000460 [Microbacterium sp. LMI12-1-1.1]|uniref:hypothetical protein n=1 Tax=Microbacterium sp. LMI12-1-1.1 TaxID=3135225 RepID=UPI0034251CC1
MTTTQPDTGPTFEYPEPRGFAATLGAWLDADRNRPDMARAAADRLPLRGSAADLREAMARPSALGGRMTPQTIAVNWRAGVADAAHELRESLAAADAGGFAGRRHNIKKAARELLRMLGED